MGGLYLFGKSPAGLYRRTPQAWGLVTRRGGEMSTEPGPEPDSLWIRVRGLPEEGRTPAPLNMWEGGFAGQADFVECGRSSPPTTVVYRSATPISSFAGKKGRGKTPTGKNR